MQALHGIFVRKVKSALPSISRNICKHCAFLTSVHAGFAQELCKEGEEDFLDYLQEHLLAQLDDVEGSEKVEEPVAESTKTSYEVAQEVCTTLRMCAYQKAHVYSERVFL